MSDPKEEHWEALKRVIRYLRSTPNFGIRYGPTGSWDDQLVGYSDADWAGDPDTRRSRTGYIFMFNGPISWQSKLQKTNALSSTEAEYIGVGSTGREGVPLLAKAKELGIKISTVPLFSDNLGAISLSQHPHNQQLTKHIELRHHWIREKISDKTFTLSHLGTEKMPADLFTKALGREKFQRFREMIRCVEVTPLTSEGAC